MPSSSMQSVQTCTLHVARTVEYISPYFARHHHGKYSVRGTGLRLIVAHQKKPRRNLTTFSIAPLKLPPKIIKAYEGFFPPSRRMDGLYVS
jgi:hypothetical protein